MKTTSGGKKDNTAISTPRELDSAIYERIRRTIQKEMAEEKQRQGSGNHQDGLAARWLPVGRINLFGVLIVCIILFFVTSDGQVSLRTFFGPLIALGQASRELGDLVNNIQSVHYSSTSLV
jgi:hypothetical protein